MPYKYGITGFVELAKNEAKKYSYFSDFYWLKEYAVLLYLWQYETDNIAKYKKASFASVKAPNQAEAVLCYEMIFPRYKQTLEETKITKDQEVIQIMLDLLAGLSFLHKKNIMHRDLKPANIMIDNGRAIIIDFSHSYRTRTDKAILDKEVATVSYRAPEVFKYVAARDLQSCMYDEKIDMWSMGIILFEITTGLNAHETISSGDDAIAEMKLEQKRTYMSEIKKCYDINCDNLNYKKTYWNWITKMVRHDPKKRISAIEMFNVVRKFAVDNNIPYVQPYNGKKNQVLSYPKHIRCRSAFVSTSRNFIRGYASQLPKRNNSLYQKSVRVVLKYKKDLNMHFVIGKMNNAVNWFITDGCITLDNYKLCCLAIVIIIDNCIYDNLLSTAHVNDVYPNISSQLLESTIILIIQKYDKELFLQDTFNFAENAEPIDSKRHAPEFELDVPVTQETDDEMTDVTVDLTDDDTMDDTMHDTMDDIATVPGKAAAGKIVYGKADGKIVYSKAADSQNNRVRYVNDQNTNNITPLRNGTRRYIDDMYSDSYKSDISE